MRRGERRREAEQRHDPGPSALLFSTAAAVYLCTCTRGKEEKGRVTHALLTAVSGSLSVSRAHRDASPEEGNPAGGHHVYFYAFYARSARKNG